MLHCWIWLNFGFGILLMIMLVWSVSYFISCEIWGILFEVIVCFFIKKLSYIFSLYCTIYIFLIFMKGLWLRFIAWLGYVAQFRKSSCCWTWSSRQAGKSCSCFCERRGHRAAARIWRNDGEARRERVRFSISMCLWVMIRVVDFCVELPYFECFNVGSLK